MEIRGLRESELDEMFDLQCLVFDPDRRERYRQYILGDPSYRLEQTRVLIVDGRIISTLRIWNRSIRIGTCPVRMGGIGGVGTHPDHRGKGYAGALMKESITFMKADGFDLSVLFSAIPCSFYRRLGWSSVPLGGFIIKRLRIPSQKRIDWDVTAFDEERDFDQVISLYDAYNAEQNGSHIRPRSYWNSAPARLRGILPTVVVRRGDVLGGYLNFQIEDKRTNILEVAWCRNEPSALTALAGRLVKDCKDKSVEEIHGEIPHEHPLVDLMVEGSGGDLVLSGHDTMMAHIVNPGSLMHKLLPDLQARLDASGKKFQPLSFRIDFGGQQCVLSLEAKGQLQAEDEIERDFSFSLPARYFWRGVFGDTSWCRLEPLLELHGISIAPEVSALLTILFPGQDLIYWGPDNY